MYPVVKLCDSGVWNKTFIEQVAGVAILGIMASDIHIQTPSSNPALSAR